MGLSGGRIPRFLNLSEVFAIMKKLLFTLFLFFFLSSCGVVSPKEMMPGINIPVDEMNTDFRLYSDITSMNSFRNGEYILLDLRNISENALVFPYDLNIKIFYWHTDQWKLVENQLGYPTRDLILLTEEEFKPGLNVGMMPFIPDMKEKTTIRIVVVGSVEDHPKDEVAAYLDVVLKP